MIPLKDESGVVDAIHITQYSETAIGHGHKALGKYLAEFVVDILEKGSVVGCYGILSEE